MEEASETETAVVTGIEDDEVVDLDVAQMCAVVSGFVSESATKFKGEVFSSPDKMIRIALLAIETDAKCCVEIGVFGGRCLMALAAASKVLTETRKKGTAMAGHSLAIGIDPFSKTFLVRGTYESTAYDPATDWEALCNETKYRISCAGLSDYVKIAKKASTEASNMFEVGSIDVLHQDGDTSEKNMKLEVGLFAERVRVGGYWVMSNANIVNSLAAQRLLTDECGFCLCEVHESWKIFVKHSLPKGKFRRGVLVVV